jgi:hypothetical protein
MGTTIKISGGATWKIGEGMPFTRTCRPDTVESQGGLSTGVASAAMFPTFFATYIIIPGATCCRFPDVEFAAFR